MLQRKIASHRKGIRKVTISVALGISFIGPSWGQCLLDKPAKHPPEGVKLFIAADKSTAKPGEEVTLRIELSNTSKTAVALWEWWLVERGYEVHVSDVHGWRRR